MSRTYVVVRHDTETLINTVVVGNDYQLRFDEAIIIRAALDEGTYKPDNLKYTIQDLRFYVDQPEKAP